MNTRMKFLTGGQDEQDATGEFMTTIASEKRSHLKSCMVLDSCISKEGGMAVSAVWRLVYPLAAYSSEPRSRPQHTGETPVPLSKNLKASGFWYHFTKKQSHTLSTQSD
jgi:hypothetical protein